MDLRADGNRIHPGRIDLAAATETDVALDGTPTWVIPHPTVPDAWYVTFDDGTASVVTIDGDTSDAGRPLSEPPLLDLEGRVVSAFVDHGLFDDPLVDGRVVVSGDLAVVLAGGTDRYAHGVLGDAIEASAIAWVDLCTGATGRIEVDVPDVIEGTAPMLADVDDDGEPEVLVTLANADDGARLAAFEFDGTLVGASEPIGQGNRWRNQLAVGPFGPQGETEIIDVRTPHIGGTVQAFRLARADGIGRLALVAASAPEFTSHVIRSRNLDMGVAVDADDDGRPDVLVASSDRTRIVALSRVETGDGWEVASTRELPAPLTSNIAVSTAATGTVVVAGHPGGLRIWTSG